MLSTMGGGGVKKWWKTVHVVYGWPLILPKARLVQFQKLSIILWSIFLTKKSSIICVIDDSLNFFSILFDFYLKTFEQFFLRHLNSPVYICNYFSLDRFKLEDRWISRSETTIPSSKVFYKRSRKPVKQGEST